MYIYSIFVKRACDPHSAFALQKHLKNTQKHVVFAHLGSLGRVRGHFEATWPEKTQKTHKNTRKTHKNTQKTHKNTQKHTQKHTKNTQKHTKNTQKLRSRSLRGHFGVTSGSLRGHRARPELGSGSLRGHFGVAWLAETSARGHFGATSGPLRGHFGSPGSPRPRLGVTSGSPRDHLARENSARGDFGVTWLKKTGLQVTSRSLGSGKLGSKSLRRHMSRKVTSKSLGSRRLESRSRRSFETMQKKHSRKLSR